ncbi:MAG TPA: HAMP domain-containing protein, partial [Ectothiorhodospiraceae bacterium]|nr:HAMP domain-containing protein [Ectothiorhodospiraceae bacterium]
MWGIKGTFLNSKVARRIFVLFVISALLPIFILAFFSVRQIHSLTTHNIERDLRQDAKSYGLSVYDRLLLLDEKLAVHAANLENLPLEKARRNMFYGFTQVNVFDATDISYINDSYLPLITEAERVYLLEGNSIVLTKYQSGLPSEIYLLQAIKGKNYIIAALIDRDALWGKADTFDDSKGLCVYGHTSDLLFCSQMQIDSKIKVLKSKWNESTTGNANVSDGNQHLFVGYWTLFTKPKFKYPKFTIAITYDQNLALEPISSLRNIFITVSILTLVVIAFLSTVQIRRYLTPLEELMRGIERISNNDFKKPVTVTANDEFYQLAVSFNSMSTRISQQFEFLTTMSDIDQQILSNITIKDVIATLIAQANNATQSDVINV